MTSPSTEQIEAGAKALYEAHIARGDDEWGDLREATRKHYRDDTRAALVAAAGAAPQAESDCWHEANCSCLSVQPSSAVDEGKIAEVVRGLEFNDAGCWDGGIDCTESVSDHADVIARAVVEAIGGESRGRSN